MKKKNQISTLVNEVLLDTSNKKSEILIAKVSKIEAEKIKLKTGKDVSGFEHVIDNYGIIHTLKSHGNKIKEALRGQIAIELKDFELIPKIILTENIIYSGKNKIGNDIILYEKKIGLVYYYAEEIRNKKKKLALNSMWKRKEK